MKHTKKKKRSRPRLPKQVGKQPNPIPGKDHFDEEESLILCNLMEAFASVSLQEAVSAYRETGGDPNKAAEILGNMVYLAEDRSETCSSSNLSTGESSSSSGNGEKLGGGGGGVCSKPKKLIAATGMLSSVIVKYHVSSTIRREVPKVEWSSDDPACKGDAEQFLCSMMGMNVI